ncbi:ABC transporter permease [Actinoplanes couchii]|uniref:Spermidine/putrescine ABC transporter permease n=1 Tax=Actinoplanes couchii TaxID=403638 RepID=A0ABQ3X8E8_9ACTN|nr:ABC transporter permease [Actinoplanes couchii]MDR6320218.1 putative spermidine/putrescine transport system permease protein [Actinoplanes couchii]GID54767.1 spermidine/putrescine ABC transporter permease [Actinoplanes couchii]
MTALVKALRWAWITACAVFITAPLLIVLVASVSTDHVLTGWPSGFTLEWIRTALSYEPFQVGFLYSIEVAALATVIALALGVPAAYAIARLDLPGTGLLRSIFVAPLSLPRVVTGFSFFVLYVSLMPTAYGTVGGVALAHVLLLLPFVISVVGSGLAGLDPQLEAAARDLGATPWRAFRQVTLPQIRLSLVIAAVFGFLTSFDEVDTSVFLMPAGTTTLPVAIFLRLEQNQDPTTSAVSSLMIAGSLLLAGLTAVALRRSGLFGTGRNEQKEQA